MRDPARAIQSYLTGKPGITAALHVGQFPVTPDLVLLINQTGGQNPYPGLAINYPSIQIMGRGRASGYDEVREQMRIVCNILLGVYTVVINTDTYRSCNQLGDVIYLGQDENGRPMFSANFWFIVLPAETGNRVPIT